VRSLVLDSIPKVQIQLIRRLGNDVVNSILEAHMPAWEKPVGSATSHPPQATLDSFITRKYKDHEFAEMAAPGRSSSIGSSSAMASASTCLSDGSGEDTTSMLFGAVWDDYIEDAVRALTFGAGADTEIQGAVDFYVLHKHEFVAGSTALHVAAAKGHTTLCELLLQNGATLEIRNEAGESPGDLAQQNDEVEVVDLFERWLDVPDFAASTRPPTPTNATASGAERDSGGAGVGKSQSLGSTSQSHGSSGVSPLTAMSSRLSLHRRRASQQPVSTSQSGPTGGFGNRPYEPSQSVGRAFPRPRHRHSLSLNGTEDILPPS
jgi:hypothetical protein